VLYVSATCAAPAGILAPLVLLIVAGVLFLVRSVHAEVGGALPLLGRLCLDGRRLTAMPAAVAGIGFSPVAARCQMRRSQRKWATGLAVLVGAAIPAASIHAAATVSLVWTATTGAGVPGSSQIEAAPGDELTLEIQLAAGPEGISSYGVSLAFDQALFDELDLVSAAEFLPSGFSFNFDEGVTDLVESDLLDAGYVLTFEAGTFQNGPVEESFSIGEVVFAVNEAREDGDDILSGLWNLGIDDLFDNEGQPLSMDTSFGAARIPEPAAGAASIAAFLALAALRARRRPNSAAKSVPYASSTGPRSPIMHFTEPPPFFRNSETSTVTGVTPRSRISPRSRSETPPGRNRKDSRTALS
jgi:hypothetical protein